MASAPSDPGLFARIGLAFACLFRVLFDAQFAGRVQRLDEPAALPDAKPAAPKAAAPKTPAPKTPAPKPAEKAKPKAAPPTAKPAKPATPAISEADLQKARQGARRSGGLLLLGLLQREGRLIDFLQQGIDDFDDDDVGAAARQVHDGCQRALKAHAQVTPLNPGEEDSTIEVPADYDAASYKLSGNVSGEGPYRGKLVHRGWRVSELSLPELLDGYDDEVVAPAEVEL